VHYCIVSFSPAPGSEECMLFFMMMTIVGNNFVLGGEASDKHLINILV
jgi:hypothetical protein